jgi:hypothetical protein
MCRTILKHSLMYLTLTVVILQMPSIAIGQGGSSGGDGCPVPIAPAVLYEETSFPGFDPRNIKSFARTQGPYNCLPTGFADFFCYHAKRLGVWPDKKVYENGCSAMDMQLQLLQMKNLNFSSVEEFLNFSKFGLFNNIRDGFRVAQEVGLCPEKRFPSEFMPRTSGLVDAYYSFQKSYQASAVAEASVLGIFTCPECLKLAPSVDINGVPIALKRDLGELISRLEFPRNSFEALKLLNQKACPDSLRIKVPQMQMRTGISQSAVYKQLEKSNPVLISLLPQYFLSDHEYQVQAQMSSSGVPAQHLAIAIGAYRNQRNNQCYIVVKSSWGDECISNPPNRICLTTGAVAIRKEVFDLAVSDSAWAEVEIND